MTINLNAISQRMLQGFVYLCCIWVVAAFSTECIFIYFQATNQQERSAEIATKFSHKFDGTFKNSPENIWYEGPKTVK
jgi:hypothetical protein